MRLVEVRGNEDAPKILFDLLAERPSHAWISHGVMPSRSEHQEFIDSHPFRYWYLLLSVREQYVGAMEVTDRNEIGIAVRKGHQRNGYGKEALRLFLRTHKPLPAIKAVRNERWLVNIAVGNDEAKMFFKRMGFKPLQETYVL